MAFPSVLLGSFGTDRSTDITKNQTGPLQFKSMITGHTVEFKAFIDSLNQSFKSTWNTENVYGRMDPVATFQGTQRSISISWTIPAQSLSEAQHNLNAIGALSSMLYPGYSANPIINSDTGNAFATANSISRSPLIKLKFSNLINSPQNDGLLGYVDGFDHNIEISMGFFIDKNKMYPKVIKMSCNFTVLHQHDVGFDEDNDWISDKNDPGWIYNNDLKVDSATPEVIADSDNATKVDSGNSTQPQNAAEASNKQREEAIAEAQAVVDACKVDAVNQGKTTDSAIAEHCAGEINALETLQRGN